MTVAVQVLAKPTRQQQVNEDLETSETQCPPGGDAAALRAKSSREMETSRQATPVE